MRPRDTAVSAVSDPEKNADSRSSSATAQSEVSSMAGNPENRPLPCQFSGTQNIAHRAGGHVGIDKGLAQAAQQDKGQLAVLGFLVVRHMAQQDVGVRPGAGNVADGG